MVEIMTSEVQSVELNDLVKKLCLESIGKSIERACFRIYPLQNVYIRKVKLLSAPKFDMEKLLEAHNEGDNKKKKKKVAKKTE
eukprot:GABW01001069.1.p2 GENE.GABW01001069.1~~GABW01001069.1.p2  ORF type:complete len:83 (+),score=47.59 GABW01001069.1:66-314(+)